MVSTRNWVFILVAFVAFGGSLINYLDRVPKRHYCDFRVYYKAGQDILKGKNIYVRETQAITPYKYSPFFAFVFAPLSLLSIKGAASVFFTINFILTLVLFKLSFQLAEDSGILASFSGRERLLIYALATVCFLRYILLVLFSGQVSILMCFLVVIALTFLYKDKAMWAGAFLAGAILIKYMPAIFLPYLLWQRKFKAVLWTIFFIGLFLLLPALLVGFEKNMAYLSSWIPSIMETSLDQLSYLDPKNQSIFSMILRIFLQPQYGIPAFPVSFNQVLFYARIGALFIYLAIFLPTSSKSKDRAIDFSLLLICMSLFNPNGWMLNFVSLIPACILLLQYAVVNKAQVKWVIFSLLATFLLINLMSKDILGKSSEDFGCAYSFTTWGALIFYAALLKLKFSQCISRTSCSKKSL